MIFLFTGCCCLAISLRVYHWWGRAARWKRRSCSILRWIIVHHSSSPAQSFWERIRSRRCGGEEHKGEWLMDVEFNGSRGSVKLVWDLSFKLSGDRLWRTSRLVFAPGDSAGGCRNVPPLVAWKHVLPLPTHFCAERLSHASAIKRTSIQSAEREIARTLPPPPPEDHPIGSEKSTKLLWLRWL